MIMKGERPNRPGNPSLTDSLWSLIQKCWERKAKDRPEIGYVINELKKMSVRSSSMRRIACSYLTSARKDLPPSKNSPEVIGEAPRSNVNKSEAAPYNMETTSPEQTLLLPEVKVKDALIPKQGATEDEDRKGLGVELELFLLKTSPSHFVVA